MSCGVSLSSVVPSGAKSRWHVTIYNPVILPKRSVLGMLPAPLFRTYPNIFRGRLSPLSYMVRKQVLWAVWKGEI